MSLVYLARQKVKGIPHHAKAGNVNSALLKESPGKGDFLLILDCGKTLYDSNAVLCPQLVPATMSKGNISILYQVQSWL